MGLLKQLLRDGMLKNISEIKPNPDNPRTIEDTKFKLLVASIKAFPEMLKLRPIVVNENMQVLGGNMRLKACKEAGLEKVNISIAKGFSEAQQKEFIIKDNASFGQWDWDLLTADWDSQELLEWGLDIPEFPEIEDFSDKNSEIDIDEIEDKMSITLNYTQEEYFKVSEQLRAIAQTYEQAVWVLLGNDKV